MKSMMFTCLTPFLKEGVRREKILRVMVFGRCECSVLPFLGFSVGNLTTEAVAKPSRDGARNDQFRTIISRFIGDAHYAQEGTRCCPRCKSCLDWGIDGDWTWVCFQQIGLFVGTNRATCGDK